jgi:hypothetical protein
MNIFLITIGIVGILVSLLNLYLGAMYIVTQWHSGRRQASVMPNTVWQLNTLPAVSTIMLFVLKHWIFTIPVLLPIIQMILMQLGSKHVDKMPSTMEMIVPKISEFLGRITIMLAPAILLTLSLTGQGTGGSTLWSWYLPALIVAFVVVSLIAKATFGWLIGVFAVVMDR